MLYYNSSEHGCANCIYKLLMSVVSLGVTRKIQRVTPKTLPFRVVRCLFAETTAEFSTPLQCILRTGDDNERIEDCRWKREQCEAMAIQKFNMQRNVWAVNSTRNVYITFIIFINKTNFQLNFCVFMQWKKNRTNSGTHIHAWCAGNKLKIFCQPKMKMRQRKKRA